MLRQTAALLMLLMTACVRGNVVPFSSAHTLALTNVTVIDVTASTAEAARLANQTVIVNGGRITFVGDSRSARLPRGVQKVNGRGRFLVPGLWDSHTHLTMFGDAALPLLVSQGVTSVRDLGGIPAQLNTWRTEVENGERTGPRIFHAGSLIEGAWWLDRVVEAVKKLSELAYFPFTEASPRLRIASLVDAPTVVSQIKASGADLIKFRNLRPAEFKAVAAEAARHQMLLAGHAPSGMPPGEAAEAGMASIEHMETVTLALGDSPDAERSRQFQRMARAGTPITASMTTDVAYRQTPDARAYAIIDDKRNAIDPRRRYLSPLALSAWRFGLDVKKLEGPREDHAALHRRQIADLRLALAAGVRILIGTDITISLLFPGYSVHEEMAYLVNKAGLTPLEALRGATIYAADAMRDRSSGRIAAGQRADMLLLSADPLARIEATSRIEAVILNGRPLPRSNLAALEDESAALAARY